MIILIIIFAFVLLTALAAIGICFRFYKKQKKDPFVDHRER